MTTADVHLGRDRVGLPLPSRGSSRVFCCGCTQGRVTGTDYSINDATLSAGCPLQKGLF